MFIKSAADEAYEVEASTTLNEMVEAEAASTTVLIIEEHGHPHDAVTIESGTVIAKESLTAPNLSIYHCIEILDFYHENKGILSKNAVGKWVRSKANSITPNSKERVSISLSKMKQTFRPHQV